MVFSGNWIVWMKTVLMFIGVLAMALFLKLSVPFISRAPILWSLVISWMKPPYLYVLINGIIISIAASSRFRGTIPDGEDQDVFNKIPTEPVLYPKPAGIYLRTAEPQDQYVFINEEVNKISTELELSPKLAGIYFQETEPPAQAEEEEEEEKNMVTESTTVAEDGGEEIEYQLHDTLDDTWKKIREGGKPTPLMGELTGSDTWKNQGRPLMKVKVRKEATLSQDELTRRAEDFIRKFNEDMRLQKLESLRRFKEMV